MSVWALAYISHPWSTFNHENVKTIASAVSGGGEEVARWRKLSVYETVEEEFRADGWVRYMLAGPYSFLLTRQTVSIDSDERWSRFLVNPEVRRDFLAVCRRVAVVLGSSEIMFLPEGTTLADFMTDGHTFDELKERALQEWGPPDIDISKIYSIEELDYMKFDRIHYAIYSVVNY